MTRTERPTAHLALFPPSRRDRRRSHSPRKVLVFRGAVGGLGAVPLEVVVALALLRFALPGAGLAGDRG